jgi:hypothetical protein
MLYDVHCCLCDWDGYTDDPSGECPGCKKHGTLEPSEDFDDDDEPFSPLSFFAQGYD